MPKDYSLYYNLDMPDNYFFVHVFKKSFSKSGIIFSNHWHEHLQFFYFLSGNSLIHCNSERFHTSPGDTVIINSNELHSGINLGDNLSYYCIRIDLSFLFSSCLDACQAKYLSPISDNLISFKNLIKNDTNINNCLKEIITEYFSKEIGFEIAIKSSSYKLLVLLLRSYTKSNIPSPKNDIQISLLKRFNIVFKYIDDNINNKIDIDDLAKLINIDKYYFCRLFKQVTGESPIKYINHLKITKAVSLLDNLELNITEISLLCGFDNSNYFSRLFKKYTKLSPKDMRKNIINNSISDH